MTEKERRKNYVAWVWLAVYGLMGTVGSLMVGLIVIISGEQRLATVLGIVVGLIVFSLWIGLLFSRKKELPSSFSFAVGWLLVPFVSSGGLLTVGMILSQGAFLHDFWKFYTVIQVPFLPLALAMLTEGHLFFYSLSVMVVQILIVLSGIVVLVKKYQVRLLKTLSPKKWLGIGTFGLMVSWSLLTSYGFMKQNNEINGYGFDYAEGLSSVDLQAYDATKGDNKLPVLEKPASFQVDKLEEMPVLDGAEAAYPVYSAFGLAVYDQQVINQQIKHETYHKDNPIQFTNTIYAFDSLIKGEVDIFMGATPSAKQLKQAEKAGVELEITPIAKEAFIFIVSQDNPINGLTSADIRHIYSGKVENWRELGGVNQKILAFQRPDNSGSQTMMTYFMKETSLVKPLKSEKVTPMSGLYDEVADYKGQKSGIGYSFRFFSEMSGKKKFKILELDGVSVTKQTITDGSYPLVIPLVVVTAKEPKNSKVKPFVKWMQEEQGQELIEKIGYVVSAD